VLLYKKDDPKYAKNYRPITLSNTTYKLWTSTVTRVLSNYAETMGILSSSQEGFRKRRGTARQLRNLVNALEDAKMYGNNLYCMYIDFPLRSTRYTTSNCNV
jgi:hypothetical protein